MAKLTKEENRRYYLHRRIKRRFHVEPIKKEVHIPFTEFESGNFKEGKYMKKYLEEISTKYNYAVLSVFI